jgi:large subunit ribosomal protein L6
MSRVAKKPIIIPQGVTVSLSEKEAVVKGAKSTLHIAIAACLHVTQNENKLIIAIRGEENAGTHAFPVEHKHQAVVIHKNADMIAGTTRALLNNAIVGVSHGFKIDLELIGVGYKVQLQGHKLNLTLGYSHPVTYDLPNGITAESPTQTEISLKGHDKCLLGQVAANIRALRPPEHYKGKGVRYKNEKIILKETKKK